MSCDAVQSAKVPTGNVIFCYQCEHQWTHWQEPDLMKGEKVSSSIDLIVLCTCNRLPNVKNEKIYKTPHPYFSRYDTLPLSQTLMPFIRSFSVYLCVPGVQVDCPSLVINGVLFASEHFSFPSCSCHSMLPCSIWEVLIGHLPHP